MFDQDKAELRARTFGLLLSLCVIALFIVWVIDTAPLIRNGITISVVFLLVYLPLSKLYKAARLNRIRANQLQKHLSQDKH